MRSKVFTGILKVVGLPLFLIKWALKAVWFLSYNGVGLLYKSNFIRGSKAGKIAYTVIRTAFLVCIVLLINFIKK